MSETYKYTVEELTVTKALRELKMSDKRITKAISELDTIMVSVGAVKDEDKKDFSQKAINTLDKVKALIKRRDAIKRAVVLSNARKEVTVAGSTMTVAEAIERKTSLDYELQVLMKLSSNMNDANQKEQKALDTAESRIESLLSSLYGRDKVSAKEAQEHADTLKKQFEVVRYDPLDTYDVYTTMTKVIDDFQSEVDDVLAVANATTTITIRY